LFSAFKVGKTSLRVWLLAEISGMYLKTAYEEMPAEKWLAITELLF
jgi:hypothetical protein